MELRDDGFTNKIRVKDNLLKKNNGILKDNSDGYHHPHE